MGKRAQGITEYGLVIVVAATVLLAMQAYFKRGIQAVIKAPVDNIGLFAAAHEDLMDSAVYAKFAQETIKKAAGDPKSACYRPDSQECKDAIRAMFTQDVAVKQEIDPKYGVLQSQSVRLTTNRTSVVTTTPGSEEKKMAIVKDEEHTEDLAPKKFWQEKND